MIMLDGVFSKVGMNGGRFLYDEYQKLKQGINGIGSGFSR